MNTIVGNKEESPGSEKWHLLNPEKKEFPSFPAGFNYLLLVLPVVFCILWIFCYSQAKTFFCSYPDSIYIYLINGTNIASGNFEIGHYDNPGTPVHILGGIIIYITHLFTGKGLVYEDVLADPEFYLRFCAGTFAVLFFGCVYFAGKLILKHTGNLAQALLFQLLPLCSFFTVHYLLLVRMCPEDLIIAVLIYYYAFLWVLSYKRDHFPDSEFSRKSYIFRFAFISALLVTTKMTCLPFLIVPLFFLKKFSQKAAYTIATIILALLMMYPIWARFPEMYDWFTRLATHSGKYGTGSEGVSADVLVENIKMLLDHNWFFTIGYFLLFLVLIIGAIKKLWKENFYKLILAFWIICTAQLALASKQFGYHYLIASQLLIIPGLVAAYYLLNKTSSKRWFTYILFVVCLIWFSMGMSQNFREYKTENKLYESSIKAKKYKDIPKIITTGYQGSCFVESGIRFGASYGGPDYYSTNAFLRKQYPESYFYDMQLPENIIKQWDIRYLPERFFQDKQQVLVYFVSMSEEEERAVLNKITAGLDSIVKKIRIDDYNKATGERFYMIEIDTLKAKPHYVSTIKLKYGFETLSANGASFLSADGIYTIGESGTGTGEKYFSGTRSLKIPAGQYICCTSFEIDPGDAFDISVKYFSPDRPVGITLSTPNTGIFDQNSESITDDYGNGWKKVSLKAVIPSDCPERIVNFCLFYFGKQTCYADDLEIVISRKAAVKGPSVPAAFAEFKKFILKAAEGNYLSLAPDGQLVANQPDAAKAEVFEKVELENGCIALKASNGMFVCADLNSGSRLIANRKIAKEWESFWFFGTDLAAVNIMSSQRTFVCADHSKKDILVADRLKASTWETFEMIKK